MEKSETRRTTTLMNCDTPFWPILFIKIFIANYLPRFTSFLKSNTFLNKLKTVEKSLDSSSDHAPITKPVSVDNRVLDGHDHGNSLTRHDVEMVMERLGLCTSRESGDELVGVSFGRDEFSRLFEDEEPSLEEVKEAFDVFDENKDGFIDAKELQRVLYLLGFKQCYLNIEHCNRMIMNVDSNGDGKIDFHEFVKFMETIFC